MHVGIVRKSGEGEVDKWGFYLALGKGGIEDKEMVKRVTCPKGHTYVKIKARDWPQGAPHCPECFVKWLEKHRKTHKDMNSVFCSECGERIDYGN